MTELPTPEEVRSNPTAVELLRAWIVEDALECTLQADALNVEEWGLALSELIGALCTALAQESGGDEAKVRRTLLECILECIQRTQGGNS